MPGKKISIALKAAWLRQMHKNYLNLLWRNGFGKLPSAALELMKDKNTWGRWDNDKRRILINEDLIISHPWEAVLGIIGHETVHQLVSDLGSFEDQKELSHGPAFKRMGMRLGLASFYLQASVELKDACPKPWPEFDLQPESKSRKMLEKVRKILALSSSPIEGEAQAAMNAAAKLIARHNLELLETECAPDDIYESRLIKLESRRMDLRLAVIARILRQHFFVENIFVPSYDPHTDTELKCLELMGRQENISLAEHVFYFLMERSESLWREYQRKHRGGGHAARNSFMSGLLKGFEAKMNQMSVDKTSQDNGFSELITLSEQSLKAFVRHRHPRLRTLATGRNRSYCPQSGQAGEQAGRQLNISSPVESRSSAVHTETRLIGSKLTR